MAGLKHKSKKNNLERLLDRLIYLYMKSVGNISWRWLHRIAKFLSFILSEIPWSRKATALNNIQNSFGKEMNSKKLYRKVVEHFLSMVFEIPALYELGPNEIRKLYRIEGKGHVLEAFRKGKGILLLTAHIGNWELLNIAFAIEFIKYGPYKASVIARGLDNPTMDLWATKIRTRFGTRVIDKQNAMRGILKALKENQAVGILLDQNVDWYQGVFVRFFGRWACTNRAMAQIALRTGSPVIPAFAMREGDFYRIRFHRPLTLIKTGDSTKDMEENTQLFTTIIEGEIRNHPEQWLWFHRRWKTKQSWPFVLD